MAASLPTIGRMVASLLLEPVKALLVAAAIFVPFERLAGLHAAQPAFRRGWAMDALTGLMNGVLLFAVLMAALGGVNAGAAWCAPQLRQWIATRGLIAQGALALVLGDLGVYGIHRLQHTLPWLWRFHAVHHSAEEMDWLVGFRFHPLDLFLLRLASLGPLVALNLSPAAIAIFMGVSGWQAWLVHANVRLPYGPLTVAGRVSRVSSLAPQRRARGPRSQLREPDRVVGRAVRDGLSSQRTAAAALRDRRARARGVDRTILPPVPAPREPRSRPGPK